MLNPTHKYCLLSSNIFSTFLGEGINWGQLESGYFITLIKDSVTHPLFYDHVMLSVVFMKDREKPFAGI